MAFPLLVPADPAQFKRNNFDAIRLAMALAVVWSHSFAIYLGSEKTEPLSILLNGTYNAGNIGVMGFFVISGFLISRSFVASKSIVRFMGRRVRRIYPGYLVATSLCAFVVIPMYAHVMDMSVVQIGKTIGANLLLRNYFPPSNAFAGSLAPNAVNGSLWSIPYEFWCYIGVAALGIVGLLNRRWFLAFVTVAFLLGRVALDLLDKKPGGGIVGFVIGWPYLWFVIAPNFLFGMLAYAFKDAIPRSRVALLALAISVLVSPRVSDHLAHIVMPLALAYATFYVAFSRSVQMHRAAEWGDFSYGAYLYAFPIQQMLFASFFTAIPFALYIPTTMCLALLAGVASWHLVERWFMRMKSEFGSRFPSYCSTPT